MNSLLCRHCKATHGRRTVLARKNINETQEFEKVESRAPFHANLTVLLRTHLQCKKCEIIVGKYIPMQLVFGNRPYSFFRQDILYYERDSHHLCSLINNPFVNERPSRTLGVFNQHPDGFACRICFTENTITMSALVEEGNVIHRDTREVHINAPNVDTVVLEVDANLNETANCTVCENVLGTVVHDAANVVTCRMTFDTLVYRLNGLYRDMDHEDVYNILDMPYN